MKTLHDYFPATIVVVPPNVLEDFTTLTTSIRPPEGGRYLERLRIVMLEDDKSKIFLVGADSHDGPKLIFSERLSDFRWSGSKTEDSQVLTQSGKVIAFKYVRGCSCGSRLRSWSPYSIMNSIKDPTS